MSLHIIGSCSKITANIVLQLAKNNQYGQITINDLLPIYRFHDRFYQLKKQLKDINTNTKVYLDKLIQSSQLYNIVNSQSDILFVTHDYYTAVTSKTKMMRLVAQYGKTRSQLCFATPVEYNHYGFQNPQQNYRSAQNDVMKLNANSTFVRSDIQDKTQFFAYYNMQKNFWQDQLFKLNIKESFTPKVVNAEKYAEIVAQILKDKVKGKILLVQGDKQVLANNVDFNKSLDNINWCHGIENIRRISSKYAGIQQTQKLVVSL